MNKKIKKKIKIIFVGSSTFSICFLNALMSSQYQITAVLTKQSHTSIRGKKPIFSPVKTIALQYNIPVLEPKSLNSVKIQQKIKKLKANVMLVVSYGIIIPKNILNIFPSKCINIHASLLPLWKGPAPIQRSILNGDTKTGITTFCMNESIDSGSIIDTLSCPINKNETSGSLHTKLSKLGIKCMFMTLKKISSENYKSIQQKKIPATYARKINKKEGKLNWNLSAKMLHRLVRAFNPSPVSYFIIKKKIIKVWKTEVLSASKKYSIGEIILINKKGLQISTSNNILNIQNLQFPGKKVINSIDCYNSYRNYFIPGIILK